MTMFGVFEFREPRLDAPDWEERMAARSLQRRREAAKAEADAEDAEMGMDEATVRAHLLPPQDAEHCAHSIRFGDSELHGIAWAGGVGHCLCCRAPFGYIAMSSMSYDGHVTTSWGIACNTHLCYRCGGRDHHYGKPDGQYVDGTLG